VWGGVFWSFGEAGKSKGKKKPKREKNELKAPVGEGFGGKPSKRKVDKK